MPNRTLFPLFRALVYLQATSIANNFRVRLRRLKQPKYLVGGIVGVAYMSLYLGQALFWGPSGSRAAHGSASAWFVEHREVFLGLGAVGVLVFLAGEWVLPGSRAALQFTETELAFLLPAPLTRRSLIHFKLLKSQVPLLFTSALFTLIGRRAGADGAWVFRWIGWWCLLFTLNLHGIGASFTLTRLLDRGITPWRRRLLILGGMAIVVAAVGFWAWNAIPGAPGPEDGVDAWRNWLEAALTRGPVHLALTPVRWILQPWFARDATEFLLALPPVILVLAAHYWWVVSAEVSFEEASIAAARKRAEIQAVVRSGRNPLTSQARKPRRPLFQLATTGFAPIALVWKNLIASGSGLNRKFLIGVGLWMAMVGWGVSGGLAGSRGWTAAIVISGIALVALVASMFFGPQVLRGDFRQDYESMDVLKTFPLPGWQVVLGQLVSPAILLTAFQWGLLGILSASLGSAHFGQVKLDLEQRLGLAAGLGILLPGFNLLSLVIPNALVLLFPAWTQSGRDGPGGIEVMGQRLLVALGTFFVLALGMLPAGLVLAGVFTVLRAVGGPIFLALVAGGFSGLVVFLAEFGVSVWLLGKVFDRFDLTRE